MGSRARQRILRPDTKSAIHKIEKLIYYCTLSKLKTFAPLKAVLRDWKDKLQTGKKYLQTTHLTKEPVFRIYKEFSKGKDKQNQIRKWARHQQTIH